MTLTATTHVPTATPGRYIGRLCKHFAHKIPVSFDDQQGRIEFDFGLTLLQAESHGLRLTVQSPDQEQLDTLKQVVASHFERFAWREALSLDWH
jgi:hypothetical protein